MPKIAILHDNPDVVARAGACAERLRLDVARLDSAAALDELLSKGGVDAILMDVVGPSSGGFELVEQICARAPRACVIVVTELDAKTVQSTERLARAKKLNVAVMRADAFGEEALKTALTAAPADGADITVSNLQDSIEQNFLRVEYQPKVPFAPSAGQRCAAEALVRLRHPRLGDVYPDQFIRIAEQNGLIEDLTDSVTRQVFADLVAWRGLGLDICIAINVSPLLLNDGVWSARFLERCEEYGIGPQDVTLEITESSMGAENAAALDVLTRLRLKGFTLSIDDFGTGFSSLSTLYKLPFGELKLDKSFIMDMESSEEARALVETTVTMARRIGLKVVAEGVETEAAFERLRAIGCDYAQGYFISRPLPVARVRGFFTEWAQRAPAPAPAPAPSEPQKAIAIPLVSKVGAIQSLLDEIMSGAGEAAENADHTLVLGGPDDSFANPAADPVYEVVRRIPSLVMKGQSLHALAACHEARLCLETGGAAPGMADRLARLEQLLERDLLEEGALELAPQHGAPVRMIGGKPVLMGRGAPGGAVDIATSCRWFSRGERNLRISDNGGAWILDDMGSTNGNMLDGAPIAVGEPVPLPQGVSEIRIGRDSAAYPPVALRLTRSQRDPSAVQARIAVDHARIAGAASDIGWSSWPEETASFWIALGAAGRASIGSAPDCAIHAPGASAPVVATIEYDGGFWVVPADGAPVMLDGCAFHRRAPLPKGVELAAGGVRFSVREAGACAGAAQADVSAPLASTA
jgi:EAL domain-containing protein (putative c-di-GMP-specific phosphodiesterase class I)